MFFKTISIIIISLICLSFGLKEKERKINYIKKILKLYQEQHKKNKTNDINLNLDKKENKNEEYMNQKNLQKNYINLMDNIIKMNQNQFKNNQQNIYYFIFLLFIWTLFLIFFVTCLPCWNYRSYHVNGYWGWRIFYNNNERDWIQQNKHHKSPMAIEMMEVKKRRNYMDSLYQ